jgi:hypothetical protein
MGWFRRTPEDEPPYAVALARFADEVDRLQDGDLLFLRSAWEGQPGLEREKAWEAVKDALAASGRAREAEDLEVGLVRWAGAAGQVVGYATWIDPSGHLMERDLRRQALPALRDAGNALLLGDVLSPDAFAVLIGPWQALTDEPDAS